MKACLSQKASIPIQEQYIQSVPTNPIISNVPRQYYQPTFPYSTNTQQINMNFYPQTQFINRNVRCNEKKDLFMRLIHLATSFSNTFLVYTISYNRFLFTNGKKRHIYSPLISKNSLLDRSS